MKPQTTASRLAATALAFLVLPIAAARAADEDGFVGMFNGKDLGGWRSTGNWVVEEGNVVALKPRPGESGWQRYNDYLATEREYGDFILDLEFKINPGGNSGVFLRVGDLQDHVESGFEVQILDTHGKANPDHHDCGGIVRIQGPAKNMVKPAGEWNRYTITLLGKHLKVVFNGEPVIDMDIGLTDLKNRPARGRISFQDEGKPVWYRNVRIKELVPDAGTAEVARQRQAELDAYWAEVSRAVGAGDFAAYQATCHPAGVLVSGGKKYSQPLAVALARWQKDFTDTREGRVKAGVSFRFAQRLGDATTAHETGIFRYVSQKAGGQPLEEFIRLEALLVKQPDGWKILMEYQIGPATKAEWEALQTPGGR
jgi:hypothetical protein